MEIYGEEQADWLMDEQYRNYKRLVFAGYNQEDLKKIDSRQKKWPILPVMGKAL